MSSFCDAASWPRAAAATPIEAVVDRNSRRFIGPPRLWRGGHYHAIPFLRENPSMKKAACLLLLALTPAPSDDPAIVISDFAALPITGTVDGEGNNAGALARINTMRQEPSPAGRLFVADLNGPLYILDRATRAATKYLDLNGRARGGIFRRFTFETGLASGLISLAFASAYAN